MADADNNYQQTRSSNRTATGRMRGQGRPQPRPQYQSVPGSGNVLVIPVPQRPDRIVGPWTGAEGRRPRADDPGMVRGQGPTHVFAPSMPMQLFSLRQQGIPMSADPSQILAREMPLDERRMTQPMIVPPESSRFAPPHYPPQNVGGTRFPMGTASPRMPEFNAPSLMDLFRTYYGG